MAKNKENEKGQFYVWIKSERIGQIVEVDNAKKPEKGWVYFTDETRCNSALISEFLMPASSEDQANIIAKDFGGITTYTNPKDATPVRPRRGPENDATEDARPVRPRRDPEQSAEVNVMREMLKKMSVKNKADLPIQVNIPSKEIYALLKDQMDITKKDLNGQISALVEDQIDNLRTELKEQIESFINNYYNGRTNRNTGTSTESGSDK